MGTRGLVGFAIREELKVTYNQFDSYPEVLGLETLKWLRLALDSITALTAAVDRLTVIDPDSTPTPEQVAELEPWTDLGVDTFDGGKKREIPSWYQMLRKTQGSLDAILRSSYLADYQDFGADGLFCEWGYVMDVTNEVFEVYKGGVRVPHARGRFAHMKTEEETQGYHPIALLASWSFDSLPTDADFVDTCYKAAEDSFFKGDE